MSAIAAKLISSVILFAATVAVSIIPVMLLNYHKKKRQTIYIIRSSDTFNVSSIATQSSHTATTNLPKQSDDNATVRDRIRSDRLHQSVRANWTNARWPYFRFSCSSAVACCWPLASVIWYPRSKRTSRTTWSATRTSNRSRSRILTSSSRTTMRPCRRLASSSRLHSRETRLICQQLQSRYMVG